MNHESVIKAFTTDYRCAEDQRDQANEDIRFITVSGGQWEGFLEEAYANRAKMEYDLVSQAVDHFMGEWEANEILPSFRDEDASDEVDDSELVSGLFRGAWRKEGGSESLKSVVFEVAAAGFGAVHVGTRYLDETNAEDQRQEATFSPIPCAYSSVVFDSSAQRMDKRDAGYVNVLKEYTKSKFEEKWPDYTPVSLGKDDRSEFNWSTKDSVYVLEHYEKKERSLVVHIFMNDLNDKIEIEDKEYRTALPELTAAGYTEITKRRVKRCHIEKSILTGSDWLEKPRRIAGKILPIIPIYGNWAYVDGQERYWGKVRKQKDPQRVLNLSVSNLAETASTSPKEAPIFAPEQVKGLHSRWADAHLGKKNFHLAHPLKDAQGNITHVGPTGYLKPPTIDPNTSGLITLTNEHIRSTSMGMPQDVEDPEASGKAILAVQKRVDIFSYSMTGNIAAGVRRIGECFLSIAEEIYTDNRKVLLIGEDGSESESQLNKIEIKDGRIKTLNSLSGKRFEVYTTVGPSYESQRRETIEFMKELLTILPQGDQRVPAVVSAIIDNMDGVGLQSIKDLNRKQMLLSGMAEPRDEEEELFMAQAQAANQEPEGVEQLIQSEVAKNIADTEEKRASTADKLASADKKEAEAAKIIQSIGLDKARLLIDSLSA